MKIHPNTHSYSHTSSCSSCNTEAWSQINVINGSASFTNNLSGCFCRNFSLTYIEISTCSSPKSDVDAVEQNSWGSKSGSDASIAMEDFTALLEMHP